MTHYTSEILFFLLRANRMTAIPASPARHNAPENGSGVGAAERSVSPTQLEHCLSVTGVVAAGEIREVISNHGGAVFVVNRVEQGLRFGKPFLRFVKLSLQDSELPQKLQDESRVPLIAQRGLGRPGLVQHPFGKIVLAQLQVNGSDAR